MLVSKKTLHLRPANFYSNINKLSNTRTLATMSTDPTKYLFNHTMLRVKDPKETVKYYEFLGMKLIHKMDMPAAKFTNYFMAYDSPSATSSGKPFSDRQGIIELCHNYGTEDDPNYTVNNGNKEPNRGFGHVCISVDNLQAANKRIEDAGYKFQKKLTDGRMKHIAFALDPNGYWVEIIGQKSVEETENVTETDPTTYKMNHSMLRVKDAKKSLDFYQNVLGMKLIRTNESKDNGFTLYFLAYDGASDANASSQAHREGILELTWNYGTEDDKDFKYHNGNDEPQGFGHICVSVDNLQAACDRFEKMGVSFKKRLTDGRMKNIAFILDPDGYWVEVLGNERINPEYKI